MEKDKNLLGNKRIEDAILGMYKNKSEETLAKVVFVFRDRIKEDGHLVVAVRPDAEEELKLRTVSTPDGKRWFAAFTSLDEELKKKDEFVSGFTAGIDRLFDIALGTEEVSGIIINPWDKALRMSKLLIELIKSDKGEDQSDN